MVTCPTCKKADRQVKAGLRAGVQRYRCGYCLRRYVSEKKQRGYPDSFRAQALVLHSSGYQYREIASQLSVDPRTVLNWIRADGPRPASSPDSPPLEVIAPQPEPDIQRQDSFGKRRPTVIDVATLAGVSVSTVSNFLNNKGRMSVQTRNRIRLAIDQLHFTPSSLVRALREHRTRIVGVVTLGLLEMDLDRNPTPSLLTGINRGAGINGYNVLLYAQWPYWPPKNAAHLDFLDGHIDGLIWIGPQFDEPGLQAVADAGLPTVCLLARRVPNSVGYVAVDNIGGIRQIVRHLASLGHRRIAYAGPVYASDFVERLEGFHQGLREVGLPDDPQLIAASTAISSDWFGEHGSTAAYKKTIDRWLCLPAPPTAIVLSTDSWAEWVAGELNRRGLRVPDDISVTGFDDVPSATTFAGGLTTVRQDFRQIGVTGFERLAALIDGEPLESCRVTIPAELVVRASTMAPGTGRRTGASR